MSLPREPRIFSDCHHDAAGRSAIIRGLPVERPRALPHAEVDRP